MLQHNSVAVVNTTEHFRISKRYSTDVFESSMADFLGHPTLTTFADVRRSLKNIYGKPDKYYDCERKCKECTLGGGSFARGMLSTFRNKHMINVGSRGYGLTECSIFALQELTGDIRAKDLSQLILICTQLVEGLKYPPFKKEEK